MTGKRKDGKDYDKYVNSFKFGYSNCIDRDYGKIDDKNVSWRRTLSNKDGNDYLFLLRVSHPQGVNGDNFVRNVVKWIKSPKHKHEFSRKRRMKRASKR